MSSFRITKGTEDKQAVYYHHVLEAKIVLGDRFVDSIGTEICKSGNYAAPRFFAFVPSPASPLSWIGDVLTDSYNPHAGTWLESSSASCLEQETIKWLCQQAGYPKTSGGLFVSGGSIANLTALVAARHAIMSEDEYANGIAYLSEQTHFSAVKALRIMGLNSKQIRMIPCDDRFRMNTERLEKEIIQDIKIGKKPFLVAATAGTTNAGCIDPLPQIADICEHHKLWFHVDGAYGKSHPFTISIGG